jgi:hypothetical protein
LTWIIEWRTLGSEVFDMTIHETSPGQASSEQKVIKQALPGQTKSDVFPFADRPSESRSRSVSWIEVFLDLGQLP